MRCINRRRVHHARVRHDRDHAVCPACRQSRDRSRGNTSARRLRARPHCPARNPVAAPAPSRPHRSRHFPSMSAPPGVSVSWLRSLWFWISVRPAVSITCASGRKRKPAASRLRAGIQPPEKCMPKECANEPKPPRCTLLELDSDPPELVRLEAVRSKKSCRRRSCCARNCPSRHGHRMKIRAAGIPQAVAIPGWVCWQFSLGISA